MPTDIDTDVPFKEIDKLYAGGNGFNALFEGPAKFIREKIVLPLRSENRLVYYHRKFERVPTIDQCDVNDLICRYEADRQYQRDKQVDSYKVRILTRRLRDCYKYWSASKREKCEKERNDLEDSVNNFFIKYGEMGVQNDVVDAYMKQKHRMIWVRRRQEQGDQTASFTN